MSLSLDVDVALVTCASLPEPDIDEPLLVDALAARGLNVRVWAWDDPKVDWSRARLAVLRSTWNYHRYLEQFEQWLTQIDRATRLENTLVLVKPNLRKRYLAQLAAAGIPVVPTNVVLASNATPAPELLDPFGHARVVIKPEVSAGSHATIAMEASSRAAAEHLDALRHSGEAALIQPFVESVNSHGERSLVYVDGKLQHAIRKSPRFAGENECVSEGEVEISDAERECAERVLATLPSTTRPPLYARVDLALDERGAPQLMELELIEPSLFLKQSPSTLNAFADAIAQRIPT
jgi:hypothetical protein